MATAMWKLEKDLCRCCHAEGSFKNLAEPCFQLGQEEIYFDMLQESLDIKIVPITGVLGEVTYTICESCIVRLRDACNFKRQVQDCEERFKDMYSRNLIRAFEVKEEPVTSEPEDMKQELQSMDDDDDDAFLNFDASEDDMDDSALSVTEELEPRGKGKGKAKPKPKPKPKQPVKKKTPKKTIKEETEVTEAAVSGEKKKGNPKQWQDSEIAKFCTPADMPDGSTKFTCNACEKFFKSWGLFAQHYKHVHLKQRKKTFPCVLCKLEVLPWLKSKHMEDAHGWPAPKCEACGRKFAYRHQVLRHQQSFHMGEKHFKCDICDMAFYTKPYLKRHLFKHSEVRNFPCSFCPKAFKTTKNLRLHTKIHMNDRRYVCAVCEDAFVQSGSLKYHMAKRHPDFV